MADTTNYGITKPTVGGDSGSWGTVLNTALDDIDAELKTVDDVAVAALPKAGGTMTGQLTTKNHVMTGVDLGGTMTGTVAVNCSLGNFFYGARAGGVTLNITNVPAGVFFLVLEIGGAGSIVWPGGIQWDNDETPAAPDVAGNTYVYVLYTRDQGTEWRGALAHVATT